MFSASDHGILYPPAIETGEGPRGQISLFCCQNSRYCNKNVKNKGGYDEPIIRLRADEITIWNNLLGRELIRRGVKPINKKIFLTLAQGNSVSHRQMKVNLYIQGV